jgi:hypothetical protein
MIRDAASTLLAGAVACIGCATASAASAPQRSDLSTPAVTAAAPSATLSAAFDPKRLGAATRITFALGIRPSSHNPPPPLSTVDFSYPNDLGFATSGLGLASCDEATVQVFGASACPANSQMGKGTAVAEVAFGPELVAEKVTLGLYAGPSPDGYLHLVIVVMGKTPVLAVVVLTAVLLPGHMEISVPPVPGLPGGPNVSFTSVKAALGGPLTYYERSHGRSIPYRPRGIGLPDRCPRGGWKLGSSLIFVTGQRSHAETAIPCPPRSTGHARG